MAALAGNYELLQEIGRGGMGIVYAGRDIRLDRLVAIKVLPELVSSDTVRERFLREARAAARLSHPSIVPIYSADDRNGVTFMVMAYVDGANLATRLRDGSVLAAADAVPILRDVALALNAAHSRGVIHRDIKPENILVDRLTGRAMVTDFGIARLADAMHAGALTRTGQVLGTVGYMSPEQVTGQEMDGRSDLYSLGVVAFETLSGKLPFDGPAPVVIVAHAVKPAPPLASVAPHVPAALCAIVDRCLRKDPEQRFASGDALAAAFEEAVGRSVATTPTRLAQGGEDRVLSENDADRVWRRAAELQAGIGSPIAARAPTSSMTIVPRTDSNGFRLEHVRAAALEAGISAAYVTLALDELLRRGADVPVAFAAPRGDLALSPEPRATPAARPSGPPPVPVVRTLSPKPSVFAGGPMSLVYEVEVPGHVSPLDFDVIASTIRANFGEAGMVNTLGRSLTWATSGMQKERQLHVTVSASAGRTVIRAEEKLSPTASSMFGGIAGGIGCGVGFGSVGLTLGAFHSPLLAFCFTSGTLGTSYFAARTLFKGVVRRRSEELEALVAKLAVQVVELIAYDKAPRQLP